MFFRFLFLIFYLFIFILRIILGPTFRTYRYNSIFRDEYNNYNDISLWVTKKIRRFVALRRSKKFLTKKHTCYTLSNNYVTVIYKPSKKIFYCRNKKGKKETTTYSYIDQDIYSYANLNELFDETFDAILSSFNAEADYKGITSFLDQYFKATVQQKPVQQNQINANNKKETSEISKEMQTVSEYFQNDDTQKILGTSERLNINTANDKELSKLPGISIILAKRIIKYREDHNGFKTPEEFYKEMKIKPHFQKQLNKLICTSKESEISTQETQNTIQAESQTEIKKAPSMQNNTERIIDL